MSQTVKLPEGTVPWDFFVLSWNIRCFSSEAFFPVRVRRPRAHVETVETGCSKVRDIKSYLRYLRVIFEPLQLAYHGKCPVMNTKEKLKHHSHRIASSHDITINVTPGLSATMVYWATPPVPNETAVWGLGMQGLTVHRCPSVAQASCARGGAHEFRPARNR